jgi:pentapeptide MXKDX repeat protein
MKKMLKIMAMLLVIGAVVFVAGCSDKNADTTADNGSQEEMTNQAPVADNGTPADNVSAEAPAENVTFGNDSDNMSGDNMSGDNMSGNNMSGDNMSGNNMSGDNMSGNNMSGDNDSIIGNNSSL